MNQEPVTIREQTDLPILSNPEAILAYMKSNIRYGWLDSNGTQHYKEMKNFRSAYRTASISQCLEYGLGVCIEQVYLMHLLFEKAKIPSRMYCCRIYEPDDFGNLEEDEHMHCFLLYNHDNKVYHMEHPHTERAGIYEYESESSAITAIERFYIELRGGRPSPTTEFYTVEPGLTFQQFNAYINSLDALQGAKGE